MVRTSDQIKWPLQKHSYKAQYQGKEKEEGKIKDGKTTLESGPVSTSTAVREQPKTVRDGRRLSSMSTVVPLGPWWFRDTDTDRRGMSVRGLQQGFVLLNFPARWSSVNVDTGVPWTCWLKRVWVSLPSGPALLYVCYYTKGYFAHAWARLKSRLICFVKAWRNPRPSRKRNLRKMSMFILRCVFCEVVKLFFKIFIIQWHCKTVRFLELLKICDVVIEMDHS